MNDECFRLLIVAAEITEEVTRIDWFSFEFQTYAPGTHEWEAKREENRRRFPSACDGTCPW